MVDIKWKVNKCCHQNHFCIPVNIISLPDALNFYISPDTKVLSHFVPLLVSCRPEHLVNSCVLCSPVAQMVQLLSNISLSLVLINHRDISEVISVISKHGYLTVNRRTGIMIDIIVMLAFINHRFCQFSIQHFRHCCTLDLNDFRCNTNRYLYKLLLLLVGCYSNNVNRFKSAKSCW